MKSQHSHNQLHVTFLPFPSPGHMIPMIDTARLLAKHGVNVTIITTHANASTFQKNIDSDNNLGYSIKIHLIQFPSAQVGLPDGVENLKDGTSSEILSKINRGISMLRDPIEVLFQELQPDCIVTDMMYPWTVEAAAKLGFLTCALRAQVNTTLHFIMKYRPHDNLASDTQKFTIPCFPHTIEMTPLELPDWLREKNPATAYFEPIYEPEDKSYGTLYNSFHELESDYEKLSETTRGIKSWSVGPVSAWAKKDDEKKGDRGHMEENGKEAEWLNWLNSKQNESVLYVSFGSLTRLTHAQLVEIAHGLENSGHNFIWVVRKNDMDENENSFLQDFEERMKESKKGYIIWNWAPQLQILDHPATGGIVTHCGWNSILESLNAGLPMIAWPMFAEQFYNEKLLVDVLKIGVRVGAKENKSWDSICVEAMVRREEIANAVEILMGNGKESKEMRMRAKKLGDASKRTIEEGGHSYNNLIQFIDEMKSLKKSQAHGDSAD